MKNERTGVQLPGSRSVSGGPDSRVWRLSVGLSRRVETPLAVAPPAAPGAGAAWTSPDSRFNTRDIVT